MKTPFMIGFRIYSNPKYIYSKSFLIAVICIFTVKLVKVLYSSAVNCNRIAVKEQQISGQAYCRK